MAKIQPHIDFGTGYVQLSKLPFDQAIELKEWLPETAVVSLNTREGIIQDAIQYSQYEYWFDYYYANVMEPDFEI